MNKGIIAIAAIIVLALGAGVILSSGGDDETANTTQTSNGDTNTTPTVNSQASETPSEATSDEIEVASAGTNTIQDYSATALSDSTTENNLLFFHAGWCSVCNSVERNIEAGNIPDDVTIFKVDYDSDEGQELASKYRIPIQYSMVQVDATGAEVTQWVNNFGDGVSEVDANLQRT